MSAVEYLGEGLIARIERRMPGLWPIACYWEKCGTFWVDLGEPHCFGCFNARPPDTDLRLAQRWEDASTFLDRAHLADRALGGLDGVQNIVPLCRMCHRLMPSFASGHDALGWVLRGGSTPVLQAALCPMADALQAGQITLSDMAAQWAKMAGIPKHAALQMVVQSVQATPGFTVPAIRPRPRPAGPAEPLTLF